MLLRPALSDFQLSPIKAMELAAAKIPGVISLAQGIPSFETPLEIREFIKEKITLGLCDKYSLTNGLPELREEIALGLTAEGTPYDPDTEIVVTAGSIEGITASMIASTEPGDEVLLPSPSYTSHQGAVRAARCTPKFVELDEDQNFDFHVERIMAAITRKTKVILFSSPNNPTGTLFSEPKVRALVDLAIARNITLIIDEVYKDFYYTNDPHFSAVQIPEARNHIIRVCSFSKAFAMTGWRVGFVHGPVERIQSVLKYHDALVTCAPVASQYGAIAALRFGAPHLLRFRAEFKERRDTTIRALDELSNVLDYQVPKAAYFAFPRIKDTVPLARDSTKLAYDILERNHVALVPGVAFGPSGESHLRITFGRSREDLQVGLTRFAEYFDNRSAASASTQRVNAAAHAKRSRGVPHAVATSLLRTAARLQIRRSRPIIIGIAGSHGKTTIKRHVSDVLSGHRDTRSTILSYNTQVGLPLSVLELRVPRDNAEWLKLPFKAAQKIFTSYPQGQLLILEYGISSEEDTRQLLEIATPDWLIISDGSASDPSLGAEDFRRGLALLTRSLDKQRVIWSAHDAWLSQSELGLDPKLQVDSEKIATGSIDLNGKTFAIDRELVGQSSMFGAGAAALLALKLGLTDSIVSSFLAPNSSK